MKSSTYYLRMFGEDVQMPDDPLACALRELVEPDPRMAEAVAKMFSEVDDFGQADLSDAAPDAVRRVGYLLERFGKASDTRVKELMSFVVNKNEPVFFTRHMTKSRKHRLRRDADELQLKWGVFGDLELRATSV